MEFAVMHRGEGKTHLAAGWIKAEPAGRVLLTANEMSAAAVRKQYGLTDRQVMSYRSVARLRGRQVEVAVDNLDCILADLLGTGPLPIALVTATGVLSREPAEA